MRIPQFLLLVSSIALGLILAAWLLVQGAEPAYSFPAILSAILIACVPTLLAYSLTKPVLDKSQKQFMQMLMTGMMAKMFVGLISIVIVGVRFREIRSEYVVTYIIAYFVFTGFEVYGLMRSLRPISKQGANTKNE
ncbi:MAG: hypothetical protein AAF399_00515 [Bacteroidota bacterium]